MKNEKLSKLEQTVVAILLILGKDGRSGTVTLERWGEIAPQLEKLDADLQNMGCDEHERDSYFDSYLAMLRHMRNGEYNKAGEIVGYDSATTLGELPDSGRVASLAFDAALSDGLESTCRVIRDKYRDMAPQSILAALFKSHDLKATFKEEL